MTIRISPMILLNLLKSALISQIYISLYRSKMFDFQMRYTLRSSLILFILLFSFSVCAADGYYFSNLSLKDGLSQITVTSIYQDKKGFMWFGTRNGLNRFDGYKFDSYILNPDSKSSISDNHILCIAGDHSGNLWIGTNNGLNRLELSTDKVQKYFPDDDNEHSVSGNMISSIYCDKEDNIWIGTNNGLNLYEKNTSSFLRIVLDGLLENNPIHGIARIDDDLYLGTYSKGLIKYNLREKSYSEFENTPKYIRSVFADHHGNIWVGTQTNGAFFFEHGNVRSYTYDINNGLTDNYVRCITESPDGNSILIGTFNGLNVIDTNTRKIVQYKNYDSENGSLSHYSILSLFFDRSQTLWVGTYAGGIDYHSDYGERFRFYNPTSKTESRMGIFGPIVETQDYLYIATEGNGLLEMDKTTENYRIYKLYQEEESAYARNILKSLCRDGDRILCGTNAGTIYSFDLKNRRFSLFHDFKSQNGIYYIGKNRNGDIIVGGVNQIGLVFFRKDRIQNSFPLKDGSERSFSNIRCVSEIDKDIYLIGTRNEGLYYYDLNTKELRRYTNTDEKEQSLPENYITSIFRDSNKNIWIGTFGGGFCLFDRDTGTFTNYNTTAGLPDNNVCTIVEDNQYHLWISTISGITDFDMERKTFRNYSYSSGIKVNEFTPHAGIRLSDNQIVFSGNNGFLSFEPDKISYNPYIPPVVLENLFINNEKVPPGGKILQKQLSEQKEITLKYNESNISIEYSALNYIFSNKNEYTYKLEGFDTEWNEVGSRRIAYYTNIPPGKYRFVVRAANNDGVWNDEGTSLWITVTPPLWKTWWAYILYTLLIIGILAFIYRYFSERKRLENDIKLKQAEAKAQDEFHEERNKLFTNFSHELRTPLTLILSPLEDMAEKPELIPQPMESKIHLMRNNARRLLRLVNNLMDFQKKESGTMKLKVSEGDFIGFSEEMTVLFREIAASRNVNFSFRHTEDKIDYWFDKNLMEKVFFNFLSNAFKNVPNGGTVSVDIDTATLNILKQKVPQKAHCFDNDKIGYIVLRIDDDGPGIAVSELEKIFVPFYQVAQNEHSASGTGLGLSLSKSIIEMHHGVIWAESTEGEGARFKCILPIDKSLYSEDEFAALSLNHVINSNHIEVKEDTEQNQKSNARKIHSILVVEDNVDVRNYIISHLDDEYNIISVGNGADAIDKAVNYLPDLIISDVMMPKMDGMEMAANLKGDLRTGHIPIIMITAKTTSDDIKEGYDVGADDYITKPFNASVLVARVRNILKSREMLKEIYSKRFSLETLGIETSSADDRFMQKLYKTIEKNVANPELNLDSFSLEIGMSKANLYRKIKNLTNLSPTEFIRNYRLEMAAKILKETKMPVSEVYIVAGFSSHAYFSNCFKNLYGISPTEYMNRISDEE